MTLTNLLLRKVLFIPGFMLPVRRDELERLTTQGEKPVFVGSTRGDNVTIAIPLALMAFLFGIVAIQSLASGIDDWTLVGGFVVVSLSVLYFAVRAFLSWRYEFYDDYFLIKHRGIVETFRYSDIEAWYAARYVPMAFHRLALRMEVKGRRNEITLNYVPYNRNLRTYVSDYLEKKAPDKRVR